MHKGRRIGVVGAGTMGAGIAQTAAQAGFVVLTLDTSPDVVKRAHAQVHQHLDGLVGRGKLAHNLRDATIGRLRVAADAEALRDVELIVEAVPEDFALKKRTWAELDRVAGPGTVLATNTSSLSVGRLAEGLSRPERFLGMHFFNPAPVMKLVELVRGPRTSDETVTLAVAFANAFGKTPIKVQDSPGFVVNRVARPFYLEAMAMLEAGIADLASIDAAVRQVGGFRMGPFELLDLIGLDVNYAVTNSVYEGFDRPARFAPNAIQAKLVEAGRLGRKTGRGFYDYSNGPPTPAYETVVRRADGWQPDAALRAFAAGLEKPADRAMFLYARIILAVINEAARAAETIALPREIDLGARLGLNHPSGPLELADLVGLDVVLDLMQAFHRDDPAARYEPAPLLVAQVRDGHLGEKTAWGFLRHAL